MKKTIAILMLGLLVAVFLSSKDTSAGEESELTIELEAAMAEVSTEIEAAMQELQVELQSMDEELGSDTDVKIMLGLKSNDSRTPKMGVYLSDLTFKRAWEMHYPYCHGVRITGTSSGGASQKAGLMEDDIIIEFDSVIARHEDHLTSLIRSHSVGDTVPVKYFRYGEESVVMLTLQSPAGDVTPIDEIEGIDTPFLDKPVKKPRVTVGNGGLGWYPVWFVPRDDIDHNVLTDVNHLIGDLGFQTLPTDMMFLNGIGLKGNIGKGWFIGGFYGGYSLNRSTRAQVDNGTVDVERRMKFNLHYGGITLEKRFPLFRKVTPSIGCMVGWGGISLGIDQVQGGFDWAGMGTAMNNNYNSHLDMHKGYMLFQPKASILVRFTDWLGIQVEGGYLFSQAWRPGWDNRVIEDDFEVDNSPDTSLDGYTITIGPWFGF